MVSALPPAARLTLYTDRRGADECWEWKGHRDKNGYGSIRIGGGRRIKAHALSYMESGRQIPPGQIIRHRCDNPPCVNPRHLEAGTFADNAHDRESRGRGISFKGAANPAAKLAPAAVVEIRRRLAAGESHQGIAEQFGVSRKAISKIANNETWKEAA